MDFVRFDEPSADPQAILEALRTSPFRSPVRLVMLEGVEEADEKSVPWLPGYVARPNPKACLVLCAERVEQKMRTALQQAAGLVQILWCQSLKGRELRDWISNQAHLTGKTIESEAVNLLITRLGMELQTLALAVESLSLLVGPNPVITAAEVEALITPSVRETAFDILDEAAAGRPNRAMEILHQALVQGRLTVEQLMGALGWYYRMVWKAKEGSASGWISPDRQAALMKLSRWPESKLIVALEEVLQADASLKLGCPAPELLADQLLLKLSG